MREDLACLTTSETYVPDCHRINTGYLDGNPQYRKERVFELLPASYY
jgi:hypothetical protein